MRLIRRISQTVLLLIFSTGLISCSHLKSVYVLDQQEIVKVKAGEAVTPAFDGWLLSNRAVTRVMESKVIDVNSK